MIFGAFWLLDHAGLKKGEAACGDTSVWFVQFGFETRSGWSKQRHCAFYVITVPAVLGFWCQCPYRDTITKIITLVLWCYFDLSGNQEDSKETPGQPVLSVHSSSNHGKQTVAGPHDDARLRCQRSNLRLLYTFRTYKFWNPREFLKEISASWLRTSRSVRRRRLCHRGSCFSDELLSCCHDTLWMNSSFWFWEIFLQHIKARQRSR